MINGMDCLQYKLMHDDISFHRRAMKSEREKERERMEASKRNTSNQSVFVDSMRLLIISGLLLIIIERPKCFDGMCISIKMSSVSSVSSVSIIFISIFYCTTEIRSFDLNGFQQFSDIIFIWCGLQLTFVSMNNECN